VPTAPYARAYVRDPALFGAMDRAAISRQLERVQAACAARGLRFFSQPKCFDTDNIDRYLSARWGEMTDRRSRCAVPWMYAEVSARGDVTTCHTFYDAPIGNVHQQALMDIWGGARAATLRAQLRKGLLPICTACCRYYQ
jgi:radical SAM protein with 4Fe4S-binding SPASM domain